MTHRASGDSRLRHDPQKPDHWEPPLIGINAPWRWQGKQAPQQEHSPPTNAFDQLAEALRPFGFRTPQERSQDLSAKTPSAESLFLQAGQSQVAYLNWKFGTQPNLRLVRLYLLMQRGWSTSAIKDAITEAALASWWLSGEATTWGVDPITQKASKALVGFLRTKPAQIEAAWQQRCQAEQCRPAAPQQGSQPAKPELMSSSEVAALLNPADRPAFNKALWRAAKAFRQKGGRKPEPLGGAGGGWALARLGGGGHGRGHQLIRARAE